MKKYLSLFLIGVACLAHSEARAGASPIALGLFHPVQLPPENYSVTGIRFSLIWGKHHGVYGLDFAAIGNTTNQEFVGLGVSGIFNSTHGITTVLGLQAAGVANINTNKAWIYGAQIAGGVNIIQGEGALTGVQMALLANLSPFTQINGFQVGAYNTAREVYGFQIGLINRTEILHGIQIGLLNFNKQGLFSMAPIMNIGF